MTDAPKIDTQAPETLWLHYTAEAIADKPELWWEYQDYERRDLADARAAAAWIAGRDAAIGAYTEKWEAGSGHALHGQEAALALTIPTDTAALDRLIAERVREAVEAEREACRQIVQSVINDPRTKFWGDLAEARARIAARGSKEGRDG